MKESLRFSPVTSQTDLRVPLTASVDTTIAALQPHRGRERSQIAVPRPTGLTCAVLHWKYISDNISSDFVRCL